MIISQTSRIETPGQLMWFAQVAERDVREDAGLLVAALAYGGVTRDPEERAQLATVLLGLPQLTTPDLRTLATAITLEGVSEHQVTQFIDALLDHHAMCPEVTVALFHNHHRDLVSSPTLCTPGDLPAAVARATAGRNVVRSGPALAFIEHVTAHSPAGVAKQLAHLLDEGEWAGSLWAAYEAASAIQDSDPVPAAEPSLEWYDPLDPGTG